MQELWQPTIFLLCAPPRSSACNHHFSTLPISYNHSLSVYQGQRRETARDLALSLFTRIQEHSHALR